MSNLYSICSLNHPIYALWSRGHTYGSDQLLSHLFVTLFPSCLQLTIWAVPCRSVDLLKGVSLALETSLHLFLKYPHHSLSLPAEVLSSSGHKVPLYCFSSSLSQDSIEAPGLQLLESVHQLSPCQILFWKVAPHLTHMNLLSAIKNLFVE